MCRIEPALFNWEGLGITLYAYRCFVYDMREHSLLYFRHVPVLRSHLLTKQPRAVKVGGRANRNEHGSIDMFSLDISSLQAL